MSAADIIREAIEAAGELRVEGDVYGDLRVWDANDDIVLDSYATDDQARNVLRLIGLLLAAAPHLEAVLDAQGSDRNTSVGALRRAITEAEETL